MILTGVCRKVLVTLTGHYFIREEEILAGHYGDAVTFRGALACDRERIITGEISPIELIVPGSEVATLAFESDTRVTNISVRYSFSYNGRDSQLDWLDKNSAERVGKAWAELHGGSPDDVKILRRTVDVVN